MIDGIDEGHRAEFHGAEADSRVLGDERFIEQTRGMIGWLAMQYGFSSLREVAERYHRDASTLTVAARKVDEKVRVSKGLRKQINALMLDP